MTTTTRRPHQAGIMAHAAEFVAECRAILEQSGGGGAVPCSRYGRHSDECEPYAILAAAVFAECNGDDPTPDALDHYMGLVVNDHPDPATIAADHWHGLVRAVGRTLGITRAECVRLAA